MIRLLAKTFESEGTYGVEFPGPVLVSTAIQKAAELFELQHPGSLEVRADGAIISEDATLTLGEFTLHYDDDRTIVR